MSSLIKNIQNSEVSIPKEFITNDRLTYGELNEVHTNADTVNP
ncbi:10575_t:CDS:2 [Entrophospora sp. SA101]|nr:255_t:CDS:2 [Entrophospora sp. SA101]CAJ0887244.1 10575_t:CDS:2 [Entrophospora sp. SA101]